MIGYYDDSSGRGGTTRYLMELLGALDRERFQPVVFAPRDREWHADLRALGVEVVTLDRATEAGSPSPPATAAPGRSLPPEERLPAKKHALRLPAGLAWSAGLLLETRQLVRLFRRRPVALLHTNSTGAEVAPIAVRLAGIPRVLGTWHVDSTYDLAGARSGLRYRLLERASMLALHRAISVSEATRQDWLRRCKLGHSYERRVTVIHNGIDPQRVERQQPREVARARYGIPNNALVIGSLGRLDPAKGYEYLLRALPQIAAAEPKVHLLIAGRGPLETELRQLATELGIAARVSLPGFASNVRDVLECLDIYVQPSLCEALGISVLEAMGIGLPVIVSAMGGLPETTEEGVTGYVVPARDPGALAQAACRLVGDADLREAMGRHGREKLLREFTRDRMVARTMAVYDEMLSVLPGTQPGTNTGRGEPVMAEQTR